MTMDTEAIQQIILILMSLLLCTTLTNLLAIEYDRLDKTHLDVTKYFIPNSYEFKTRSRKSYGGFS